MSKLILTRHGQSVWNAQNKFTGWVDSPLSEHGTQEAIKAGKLIKEFESAHAFKFPWTFGAIK